MSTSAGDWTTLVPVTGEAVALDLRVAQFPSRMLALALDLALQLIVLYGLLMLAMSIAASSDSAVAAAVVLLAVVGAIIGMPTLIETLTRGRSIGKIAAGLRVVRDDGGPVRFRHSFVRALFMLVDFWMTGGFVGIVSSLSSKQGKRLGDHFAGTVVVRERVPSAVRTDQIMYAMPPELEPWAASLDVSRLPDVAALHARQLLARANGLAPDVRSTMATQLAAEFSAYVSPPPPPGVHAEIYLHTGGQYEWDSCAPVAVARAHGLHVSRADGAPLVYNQPDTYMPDLLICRPEWAGPVLAAMGGSAPRG